MGRKRTSRVWLVNDEDFSTLVSNSKTYTDIVRSLGFTCISQNIKTVKARISEMSLSVDHFDPYSRKNYKSKTKLEVIDEYFNTDSVVKSSNHTLIKYLIKYNLIPHQCECGLTNVWRGKPLVLQLDHIDGDRTNNTLTNLRFMCANCHTQTPTYAGRKLNVKHICSTCGGECKHKSSKFVVRVKPNPSDPRYRVHTSKQKNSERLLENKSVKIKPHSTR